MFQRWVFGNASNSCVPMPLNHGEVAFSCFGLVECSDDAWLRLAPGLVRIPDVSFVSFERLPERKVPREPIARLVPDLAVEVLSASNTHQEMERKLRDYFTAGVRLVWFVDPPARTVTVFTAPEQSRLLHESDVLDGGEVLPGFTLPLVELFAEPGT